MSHLFRTVAFKQNKQDTSYLKLDDVLPETIITILTTGANLARYTSDKVSKHIVCPQGTRQRWHRLRHLIKGTAAYFFSVIILAYIGVLADTQYLISKPISVDNDNITIV